MQAVTFRMKKAIYQIENNMYQDAINSTNMNRIDPISISNFISSILHD